MPVPVDMSGVWAGTWQGTDPNLGLVTGFMEASMQQNLYSVTGNATLLGDVDCMDGSVQGSANTDTFTGTFTRGSCQVNTWKLTSLNISGRSATGDWGQAGGAKGTFSVTQISKSGGPQIAFINPPGGLPGTVVSIVGSGFDAVPANDSLTFNSSIPATPTSTSTTVITTTVPNGISTGMVNLTKGADMAISPRPFSMDVSSPNLINPPLSITVGATPQAIAFSPDGRKAYVASNGSVYMINTICLLYTSPSPRD